MIPLLQFKEWELEQLRLISDLMIHDYPMINEYILQKKKKSKVPILF